MPSVAVVMGSKSDAPVVQECLDILDRPEISYGCSVASSSPDARSCAGELALKAPERGVEVFIAAAGRPRRRYEVSSQVAHAALPVIGIPLASSELRGVDALYAIVRIPPECPRLPRWLSAHGGRETRRCLPSRSWRSRTNPYKPGTQPTGRRRPRRFCTLGTTQHVRGTSR